MCIPQFEQILFAPSSPEVIQNTAQIPGSPLERFVSDLKVSVSFFLKVSQVVGKVKESATHQKVGRRQWFFQVIGVQVRNGTRVDDSLYLHDSSEQLIK